MEADLVGSEIQQNWICTTADLTSQLQSMPYFAQLCSAQSVNTKSCLIHKLRLGLSFPYFADTFLNLCNHMQV